MSRAKRIVTTKEKKLLREEVKQIAKLRKAKGLTQTAFAKLIGKSASNVGNIEAGYLLPNDLWISKAKAALNLKSTEPEVKQENIKPIKNKSNKINLNSDEPSFNGSPKLNVLARSLISAIANELLKKECK